MTSNSNGNFWPLLTVVLLEASVVGALSLGGGTAGALLSGHGLEALTRPTVIGAIVVPFLGAFFGRLQRRMPALREAVGLKPLSGNTNGGE